MNSSKTISSYSGLGIMTQAALFLGNFLLLLITVPPASLGIFFAASLLLMALRPAFAERHRQGFLTTGIIFLTILLLYYRASPLFSETPPGFFWGALAGDGWQGWLQPGLSIIGVSYCYLRSIYALTAPQVGLWGFTRYYFFFPTFFSGPILAPQDYLGQTPAWSRQDAFYGLLRILLGLMKFGLSTALQVVVPLTITGTTDLAIELYGPLAMWGWAFMAGLWLYLNFSGFSDLAIGAGRLMGITVLENFNHPYRATDIADFWRRWHISLGNWLRANIFNPTTREANHRGLGAYQMLLVPPLLTMVVCGLWHGVTLPFLFWGAYHGLGLAGQQWWKAKVVPRLPPGWVRSRVYTALAWFLTQAFVTYGWVFFFPVDNARLLFHLKLGLALLGYTR